MRPLEKYIAEGAAELGVCLPSDAFQAFNTYYDFLEEKNRVMNLTAIAGERDTARLHFLDSLAVAKYAPLKGSRVIDVGSGAGFPGVPLKIAVPDMRLTALDALGKRVEFLSELCERLGVDADCVHARAEEAALKPDMRDGFDFAVSRAVANLGVLCELCLPFVKVGGAFLAMKSTDTEDEINDAKSAIKTLGGKTEDVFDYKVPLTDIFHRLVIIRKTAPTPDGFPRRFTRIKKAPL